MLVAGKTLLPRPFTCEVLQDSTLYYPLFNINLKLLGEVIHRFAVWHHQYIDDTQLNLLILTQPRELNLIMTKWLWLFRPPSSGDVPTLTTDKVALFHSRVVCNLEMFLDLEFLPDEQIRTVVRKAFAQLHLVCTFFLPAICGSS